jgi:hypothetical protein
LLNSKESLFACERGQTRRPHNPPQHTDAGLYGFARQLVGVYLAIITGHIARRG